MEGPEYRVGGENPIILEKRTKTKWEAMLQPVLHVHTVAFKATKNS